MVDRLSRAQLHDLPQIHDGNVVTEKAHHAQIVGNKDHRCAILLLYRQK